MSIRATDPVLLGPDHPRIAGRTGSGVSVAVIDSGVNPGHPHVGRIAGGIGFSDAAEAVPDVIDSLGHGTAVVAAIQEKAPDAELYVVKVFDRSLSTTVEALVRAIEWAVARRVALVNLSLGTANPRSAPALADAVEAASRAGTLVVSAREHGGRRWFPGSLPGVLGVVLDASCSRDAVRLAWPSEAEPIAGAAGEPRPVPGLPQERNLQGVSFAVANATGVLARLLEGRPRVRGAAELAALLHDADFGRIPPPDMAGGSPGR